MIREPDWTSAKILTHVRIRSPDIPAHSNVQPSTDGKDANQMTTFCETGDGIHITYYPLEDLHTILIDI